MAEPTTMSMLGPVTCNALTVIDPLDPPDELVCWLMMTLLPPGREIERFGFETRIDWPATVNPTSSALPLVLAELPLHVALELDFTAVAATKPFNKFTSRSVDCDWLVVPLPDAVLFSASAEAIPATLTLATDVLRFPPLDGSAPVSASASEMPTTFAFKATASPLNVVACARPTAGPKAKTPVRQIAAIIEVFLSFMIHSPCSSGSLNGRHAHATVCGGTG